MSPGRRSGPEPKPETALDEVPTAVLHIVTPTAGTHQGHATAAVGYVVLVEIADEKFRRTAYFSLPAAARAVERAHRRGVAAHVVLCDLVPVRDLVLDQEVDER